MLRFKFTILLTGLMIVFGACSEETKRNAGEVNDQIESTVESAKNDAEQTKAEFIADAQKKIEELNEGIEEAENKLKKETGEIKGETRAKLNDLKDKRDSIKEELSELKESGEDNWVNLKNKVKSEIESLKARYNNFVNDLKLS